MRGWQLDADLVTLSACETGRAARWPCSPGTEIERLLARLEGVSEQEALDQVYRRRTLHLCGPCFRRWIENPTG